MKRIVIAIDAGAKKGDLSCMVRSVLNEDGTWTIEKIAYAPETNHPTNSTTTEGK